MNFSFKVRRSDFNSAREGLHKLLRLQILLVINRRLQKQFLSRLVIYVNNFAKQWIGHFNK